MDGEKKKIFKIQLENAKRREENEKKKQTNKHYESELKYQ